MRYFAIYQDAGEERVHIQNIQKWRNNNGGQFKRRDGNIEEDDHNKDESEINGGGLQYRFKKQGECRVQLRYLSQKEGTIEMQFYNQIGGYN